MTKNLYTKDQMERLFGDWKCAEPLPKKEGRAVWVCFPPGHDGVRVIRVTRSAYKSTYGKALYLAEFNPTITLVAKG